MPASRALGSRAVAAIGIAILSPLLVLAALAVRLSSSGPVLFNQERVGRGGRTFRIHKFRTMRVERGGREITVGADPRVTVVGAVLRRLKLDELPQLFNIAKGEMAFVGPRPEVPRYVALWPGPARAVIQSVRPGLTDIASLVYIDESGLLGGVPDPERYYVDVLMPAKLGLAEAYVRNRNAWLDFRILAATATGILGLRWIPSPFGDNRAEIPPASS